MNKAKKNSKTSGKASSNHFIDITKMVHIGSITGIHARAIAEL